MITIAKIEAGSTRNVIPETAHMRGTIRTVSERTRERVLEGVERLVKGLAAAHGAEAEVKLIRGYPVTVTTTRASPRSPLTSPPSCSARSGCA